MRKKGYFYLKKRNLEGTPLNRVPYQPLINQILRDVHQWKWNHEFRERRQNSKFFIKRESLSHLRQRDRLGNKVIFDSAVAIGQSSYPRHRPTTSHLRRMLKNLPKAKKNSSFLNKTSHRKSIIKILIWKIGLTYIKIVHYHFLTI